MVIRSLRGVSLFFPLFPSYICRNNKIKLEALYSSNQWDGFFNFTSPAIEVLADCQDNEEDQGNHDAKNDELHLHILPPHLPPYLCSLLPEVLCLQVKQVDLMIVS